MTNLVGKEAPDFTACAVMPDNSFDNNFNLKEYLDGKIGVLFFYPLDFTFVCPSEILAFNNKLEEFEARNARVISVSVDSHFSHLSYKNTLVNKGGIGNIQFPMVSDLKKNIVRDYDVMHPDTMAYRATFIIDQEGIVRHQLVNDLPLGRNIDEAIRTIDALLFHQQYGDVCPANWTKGQEGMKPTKEGVTEYLAKHATNG